MHSTVIHVGVGAGGVGVGGVGVGGVGVGGVGEGGSLQHVATSVPNVCRSVMKTLPLVLQPVGLSV